jgi:hypothetical protein
MNDISWKMNIKNEGMCKYGVKEEKEKIEKHLFIISYVMNV